MLSSKASFGMMILVTLESGATLSARKALAVTLAKTGPATVPPKWLPALGSSSITAMIRRGSDIGAMPTNEDTYFFTYLPPSILYAVPVLPPTRYPGTCACGAVPPGATTVSSMRRICNAVFSAITRWPIGMSFQKVNDMPIGHRVIAENTALQMRRMLETVVAPGGTAPQAQVPGYRVGGKTGSAYKIVGGKYVKQYVSSFVGIAPMSDPRLIIAVMIDEPSAGSHFGGTVAGPVFANVTANALRALNVAPDSSVTNIIIPKDAIEESM